MKIQCFKGLPIYSDEAFEEILSCIEGRESLAFSVLPFIAGEILETLGICEGLKFIYNHGGKKFYLPRSRLALPDSLYSDISEQLFDHFYRVVDNSGYIEIPSPWGVFGAIRKIAIEEQVRAGADNSSIQAKYGITLKALYNTRKRVRIHAKV